MIMIDTIKQHPEFWLRLDNAAKIYPAIRNSELTAVFRLSVYFNENIRKDALLAAMGSLENRFPYYKVKLGIGVFWYYLEYSPHLITLKQDKERPCREFGKKEVLFRVLAGANNLSVEFSHMLTDATGAFEFMRSLILVYSENCGVKIPPGLPFLHPGEIAQPEEYEDAYGRYFKKGPLSSVKVRKAFHLPFPLKNKLRFDVLTAIVPLDQISQKAKENEVSITVYFIAVYLYSLQKIYNELPARKKKRSNRILRIEVPVNLRKIFPSKTMRNFSLYVLPEIDLRLGEYTFDEILKSVHHQMQLETDSKLINKIISRNVGSLNNNFVRRVPLFIKSMILSKFYAIGTGRYSGVITNMGKIDISNDADAMIDNFRFIPPPPNKILKVNCGIVGFGNKVVLSFGNITSSKILEHTFLQFLRDKNINVSVIPPQTNIDVHSVSSDSQPAVHQLQADQTLSFIQNLKVLFKKLFHV